MEALGRMSGCPVPSLSLVSMFGNHGHGVHFTAGGGQSQHRDDGQKALVFGLANHQIPRVSLVRHGACNHLGAVNGGASADGNHNLHAVLTAQLDALAHRRDTRIGLHARKLNGGNAGLFQRFHSLVVNPGLLDAAAAIDQQGFVSPGLDRSTQIFDLDPCRNKSWFRCHIQNCPCRSLLFVMISTNYYSALGCKNQENCLAKLLQKKRIFSGRFVQRKGRLFQALSIAASGVLQASFCLKRLRQLLPALPRAIPCPARHLTAKPK